MQLVIADDHPLVRRGLVELLRAAHPEWTFQEAGTFDEVIRCCGQGRIDLASVDLLMPGLDGPGALAAFRAAHPGTRLVVLTGTDDRATVMGCVAAGVHGYVLKSSASDHLVRAVEMIIDGGIYLPSALAGAFQIVARPGAAPPAVAIPGAAPDFAPSVFPTSDFPTSGFPTSGFASSGRAEWAMPRSLSEIQGLTARQREVLDLLAQGCSTKDIARRLNLGVGTVKVHLAGVYKTLGARNRMEAVVKAGKAMRA